MIESPKLPIFFLFLFLPPNLCFLLTCLSRTRLLSIFFLFSLHPATGWSFHLIQASNVVFSHCPFVWLSDLTFSFSPLTDKQLICLLAYLLFESGVDSVHPLLVVKRWTHTRPSFLIMPIENFLARVFLPFSSERSSFAILIEATD